MENDYPRCGENKRVVEMVEQAHAEKVREHEDFRCVVNGSRSNLGEYADVTVEAEGGELNLRVFWDNEKRCDCFVIVRSRVFEGMLLGEEVVAKGNMDDSVKNMREI